MNKNIFCALVAAGVIVSTPVFANDDDNVVDIQNTEVNVFGEARAFIEGGTVTGKDPELKTSDSKLGVKFTNHVNPLISIFGELSVDVDINGNGSDDVTTRYGYVGMESDFLGAISLGKTESIMETYVNKGAQFKASGNGSIQQPSDKLTNSIRYEKVTPLGVTLGIQSQMLDGATDETFDLWEVGVTYEGVGVTYADDAVNNISYYGIGVSRTYDALSAHGSFSVQDTTTTDIIGYELVAGYAFKENLTFLAGYGDTDVTGDDGLITGGAHYEISSDAVLFTEIDYDLDTEESVYSAGLGITF
jgi:predicted porin|tara:strand:+ start:3125 stop:4036 length:912 start_codon:yes stop_codon:yes gene_type:complete